MLTRLAEPKTRYRVVTEWVESPLLKGNPSGFEARRPLTVLVPEGDSRDRFPVLYNLAAWTRAGRTAAQWEPFRESLTDRLERLTQSGVMKPSLVVCPDLYSWYGGSQFINSSYFGPHADHIVKELLPYIEANYPALPGAASRAVFGISSGGYGALRLAMDYPGEFAAIACHSGDMGFELLYRRDLVEFCYALARYSGSVDAYIEALKKLPKLSGKDTHLLMLFGMAGFYSPNHKAGYDLPIDPLTGEVRDDVWRRWLEHDPVVRLDKPEVQAALRQLKLLYIECGSRDQYHLQFGARQLRKKLEGFGIAHKGFEFDDNHSGTSYRYDISLPMISEVLRHQS